MLVQTALPPLPFAAYPPQTKIWIYQTGKSLAGLEPQIAALLDPFTQNWLSHNVPVQGGWAIYADACLLVAAYDEQTGVSGCSTDGLVRTIQQLSANTGQDFFNRTDCALLGPDGLVFEHLTDVKKGLLPSSAESLYYLDITANSLDILRGTWPVPLLKSWIRIKSN
jgi:hypothetical protein